jgi:hypothetical protein
VDGAGRSGADEHRPGRADGVEDEEEIGDPGLEVGRDTLRLERPTPR